MTQYHTVDAVMQITRDLIKANGLKPKHCTENIGKKGMTGGFQASDGDLRDYLRNGRYYNQLKSLHGFERWTSGHGIIHKATGICVYAGPHGYVSVWNREWEKAKNKAARLKEAAQDKLNTGWRAILLEELAEQASEVLVDVKKKPSDSKIKAARLAIAALAA